MDTRSSGSTALFTRIDHVGIAVRDLDEAKAFYAEAFGMTAVHEEVNEEQGVREAMLSVGDSGSSIQLLAPLSDASPIARFLDQRGPGIQQLAYRVRDLDAVSEVLRERGYEWWIRRMSAAFDLFDLVRLDHFRGFHAYWEVPGNAKTAALPRIHELLHLFDVSFRVLLPQRGHRPFDEAAALAVFVRTDLDDLVGELFRQLLAQDWHGDIGARHHDVLDLFFAHDFGERIDDFLDVMHMEVVGAALISFPAGSVAANCTCAPAAQSRKTFHLEPSLTMTKFSSPSIIGSFIAPAQLSMVARIFLRSVADKVLSRLSSQSCSKGATLLASGSFMATLSRLCWSSVVLDSG